MSEETQQDTNLRELLAQRVHVPDVGLENAGDIVTFNNQESAVVTVKGKRLRLVITSSTTFELKHGE
jgi:hypothetical protein